MSKISDEIAAAKVSLDAAISGITAQNQTIQSLNTQVASLQAQIANGGSSLTADDQSALDALVTEAATAATDSTAAVAAVAPAAPTP